MISQMIPTFKTQAPVVKKNIALYTGQITSTAHLLDTDMSDG